MEIDTTKLLKMRNELNISQNKVCVETGINHATLSMIESGKNKNPEFKTIVKLAEFYSVTVDSILK